MFLYTPTKLKKMAPETTLAVAIDWKMINFKSFTRWSMLVGEYLCIITSELPNQSMPKALTNVVYTNMSYCFSSIYWVDTEASKRAKIQGNTITIIFSSSLSGNLEYQIFWES